MSGRKGSYANFFWNWKVAYLPETKKYVFKNKLRQKSIVYLSIFTMHNLQKSVFLVFLQKHKSDKSSILS